MANTTAVYARVDTSLKEKAEGILSQLGISPSSAIQMLYSQIVLQRGMPFESRLPEHSHLIDISSLTEDELAAEVEKGLAAVRAGDATPADEAFAALRRKYDL
ncbi:MAG: type II toxin-antitoxin system RelB/DinJ family antitoxin [Olsenella sp.]|nr:type II toxin-antitoxin system RelB/DinJ family antitoxin [Olsenella sp.]